LIKKVTKKSSLRSLVGQISFLSLKQKNSPPQRIKQFLFLRLLPTFDARLRKLRTGEEWGEEFLWEIIKQLIQIEINIKMLS
jgi:hypothetical protein